MSFARLEEVAVWDEEGTIDGLQFDGRERRLQEWRERKEEREFSALVERLQKRNAAQRARQDPVRMERIRLNDQRYRETGQKQLRENARRREKYEADPVVNTCVECRKTWSPPYEQKVKKSRFCSRSCRNRNHARYRQRPTKGIRDMAIRDSVVGFLRKAGGSTSGEIATAIKGKPASVRTCLYRWVKEGSIKSDGLRPALFWVE